MLIFLARYLIFLLPVPAVYLLWRGKRSVFWRALLSSLLALAVSEVIKYVFAVPRPFVADGYVSLLGEAEGGSFPSSHTTLGMALSVSYWFYNKKLGAVCAGLAIMIGIARVLGGIHYPLDILGGAFLGIVVSFFVHHLVIYYRK